MNRAVRTLLTYDMQITGLVGLLVGVSIILFEIFPRELVNLSQADEHMIAVPASGGLSLLLRHIKLAKEQERFWKRLQTTMKISLQLSEQQ